MLKQNTDNSLTLTHPTPISQILQYMTPAIDGERHEQFVLRWLKRDDLQQ